MNTGNAMKVESGSLFSRPCRSTSTCTLGRRGKSEWVALVAPWATILLIACVSVAVTLSALPEVTGGLLGSASDTISSFPFTLGQHHRSMSEGEALSGAAPHPHAPIFQEDHAPLFPLKTSDYYGLFFAVIGLVLAAGGGIGGGGILVPIYILVMGFSPKHAVPLSNVTVFGGAVANVILNSSKRHPLVDRPLVDWDLILVMEPLTIAGALMGAFLNKLLPELLLTVLLVMLLASTAWETLTKATKMFKLETIALKKQGIDSNGQKGSQLTRMAALVNVEQLDEAAEKLLDDVEEQDISPSKEASGSGVDTGNATGTVAGTTEDVATTKTTLELEAESRKAELDQIVNAERVTPRENLNILITMFVVVLAVNVLKGGGAFRSPLGIVCGSNGFWLANAFMITWIVAVSTFVRRLLLTKFYAKKRCGYQYVDGDIQWDERASLVYPSICMFAGCFAGMFGVGGGIVKGPLMLAMGVHPAVSSASSACMILFTSFTATTSYIVFGLLITDYAVMCLVVGFIATFAGQVCLMFLMKKNKRNSYIAFSIGGVVLVSALLMTVQSLLSMASGETHHSGGICGKGD